MKINTENYEIFFLAYYEETLSKSEAEELSVFLEMHAALKAEFEHFENIRLVDEGSILYEFKESLKKIDSSSPVIIYTSNYREFFIAACEGDLNAAGQKQLEIFLLQHPELQHEYHLFEIAKLKPDTSIIFENKRQFKKFSIFNLPFHKKRLLQTASIAASFLLLASVGSYYFMHSSSLDSGQLAIQSPQPRVMQPLLPPQKTNDATIPEKQLSTIPISSTPNRAVRSISHPSQTVIERNVQVLQYMATRLPQPIQTEKSVFMNSTERSEFTTLNDLLSYTEDPINNHLALQILTSKEPKRFELDPDLLKDQPIARAGGFLKNFAVLGFTRVEELAGNVKQTYLALEEKVNRK